MGKPYASTVANSEAELRENNATPGKKHIGYFLKPNGFKMAVDGRSCREVVLVTEKKNRDGSTTEEKVELVEMELVKPNGEKFYEYRSPSTFINLSNNVDFFLKFKSKWTEGIKGRQEEARKLLAEGVKTLKGAGLIPQAIVAALKAQGCDGVEVQKAVDEAFKS